MTGVVLGAAGVWMGWVLADVLLQTAAADRARHRRHQAAALSGLPAPEDPGRALARALDRRWQPNPSRNRG